MKSVVFWPSDFQPPIAVFWEDATGGLQMKRVPDDPAIRIAMPQMRKAPGASWSQLFADMNERMPHAGRWITYDTDDPPALLKTLRGIDGVDTPALV